MKNVSRNKFLVCFRPVVDMDLKPSMTRSSVSDTEKSVMVRRPGKKTLSRVIKAVVFEILLAKRVKDRKAIGRGSYSSKHTFPGNGREYDEMLATSAGYVLASQERISESDSVPDSTSKHQEPEVKEKREGTHRSSSSSNGVFWFVISLAMTVFWGKFCAILFTSIWLYFLPRLQRPAGDIENLESIKRSSEKMSKDYKRKVIMEGYFKGNKADVHSILDIKKSNSL